MSITKIVATFTFVICLTVAFSSPNEVQAQSGSRSVGDVVGGAAGSSTRSLPSVVTDFGGGAQQSFGGAPESFSSPQSFGTPQTYGDQQSYVAPQVEYSGAPLETQYSSAPMVSSAPAYSAPVSSGCGCSAAPAPAPQPMVSPCGGGCGGGCGGSACGGGNWPTLRPGPATGRKVFSGGMFQRGRPCGCN